MSSAAVSHFERTLRARGMRVTAQRQLIFEAVNELRHATPEQIFETVGPQMPGLTLSTVYRALEALETAELVTHTHLGHTPLTYHAVDDHAHVHLVCEGCGAVSSVSAAVADALRADVLRETGFHIDPTHMAMAGRCAACGGTPGSK